MRRRVTLVAVVLLLAVAGSVYAWWWSPFDVDERVVSYRGSPRDTRITVNYSVGVGDRVMRVEADEHTDRVVVTVRVRRDTGDTVDVALPRTATVTLAGPLRDRVVIDASTGEPVPHEQHGAR